MDTTSSTIQANDPTAAASTDATVALASNGENEAAVPSVAAVSVPTAAATTRKRLRDNAPMVDAVTATGLIQAAQQAATLGWNGLAQLLQSATNATTSSTVSSTTAPANSAASASGTVGSSSSSQSASAGSTAILTTASAAFPFPSVAQVQQAAAKAIQDSPPWIHWTKADMAPQLKCTDTSRLALTGAMRGYRMARASHGVSAGNYFFECWILPGPSAREIAAALPAQARLGPGLQEQLQKALAYEEKQEAVAATAAKAAPAVPPTQEVATVPAAATRAGPGRKRKEPPNAVSGREGTDGSKEPPSHGDLETPPLPVGGHLRIGWSMRTGDLQAPVGYDKWSYGIRDIGGSIIHQSQRQDNWGGEGFVAGDILGCAIILDTEDPTRNHIRFFKNGDCMGEFVLTKGKREGGEAFAGIEPGTYYPAVSSYMGGAVKANFGPHWVYPPRKLPPGLKLKPLSDLCPPPLSPEEALAKIAPTIKLFRKSEQQQALKESVLAEARAHCDAYANFSRQQIEEVRQQRVERGLSVQDLPDRSEG